MAKNMMPYMTGYTKGYKPPTGSAGAEAKGQFSYNKNPKSVPKKGSEIKGDSGYPSNSDKEKVMRLQKEQSKNESLRGYGC